MGTVTYTVMREHLGDRQYAKGETRELDAGDAKHLVEAGVLQAPGDAAASTAAAKQEAADAHSLVGQAKAERAAQNKAMPAADQNKTAPKFKPLPDDE